MKTFLKILPFLFFIFISCKHKTEEVKPVEPTIDRTWNSSITDKWGQGMTLLSGSKIQNDQLNIYGFYATMKIKKDNIIPNTASAAPFTQSYLKKSATSSKFISLKAQNMESIAIMQYNCEYCAQYFLYMRLATNNYELWSELRKYTQLNSDYDVGAFTESDKFMLSVIDKSDVNTLTFVILNINEGYLDNDAQPKLDTLVNLPIIKLPNENSLKVRRMKGFANDFFVSTNAKTYKINETGTYQKIFDLPFNDMINIGNTLYVDLRDEAQNKNFIAVSQDNGNSWQTFPTPAFQNFRELATIKNSLYFYADDIIYKFDTQNYTYKILSDIETLKNKKITSMTEFYGRVYVTTLQGAFFKDVNLVE